MLFLLFQLGKERYALPASKVVEVVPLLTLKALPKAPPGVAGIFNYRGSPVPAVDISELTLGYRSSECLSTRIIVVEYPDANGNNKLLGLIAEHATEMLRRDAKEFLDAGVKLANAPFLGPILMDAKGPVQLIQEQKLLDEPVRDLLFQEQLTLNPPTAVSTS